MERGLRLAWGKIVPGMEKESLELFQDAVTYFGKKMADGKVTYFEPFIKSTGDYSVENGFFIVKGPAEEIHKILDDEDFVDLTTRSYIVITHFKLDLLHVGEDIEKQLKRFEKFSKV